MKRRLHIWLFVALEVAGLLALATSEAYAVRFRSRATGLWSTAGTWDRSLDGGQTWALSPVAPTSTATDTVEVLSGHTITMNGNAGNCRTLTVAGILNWTQNRTTNVGIGGIGDLNLDGGILEGTAAGTLNVQGSVVILSGDTGTVRGVNLSVTGSTTISGVLNFATSTTGTKTFSGPILINSGGTWNNAINEAITIRAGLTHNGAAFNSGTGTYTFNLTQAIGGTSPISFGGAMALQGSITLTNTGTVSVAGTITGTVLATTWLNSAGSSLSVGGAFLTTGTVNAAAEVNTVQYTGAAQIVKATTYSNLILSGSGAKTTTGVTVTDTLSRRGTATISATPAYQSRTVLEYAGSAAQITGPEFPSSMTAAVVINNANGVTLDAAKTVDDSLIISVGSLADGGFQITGNAADSLIMAPGTVLTLGSAATGTTFPTNFGARLDAGSTVIYGSNVGQVVAAAPVYADLTMQGTGTKSTAGSSTLTVQGDLTLAAGTLAPGAGSVIDLSGDWTNNGGAVAPGSNTVRFVNAASGQSINGTAVTQTFNNVEIVKGGTTLSVGGSTTAATMAGLTMTSGTFSIANATTVAGTLTLTAGNLDVGSKTLTLDSTVTGTGATITSAATGTVVYDQASAGQNVATAAYGHLTFSNFDKVFPATGVVGIAGVFTPGSATGHTIAGSTIDFNGSGAQTIAPFTYHHLTVSAARGGQTVTLASGTVNVQGNLSITATSAVYATSGNTVVLNGSSSQSVDAFTFGHLTIGNAAGVTLDGNVTVQGTLTLTSGNVTTGAFRVVVDTTGIISRTNGHIVGSLERGVAFGSPTAVFPVGTGSVYVPVTAAFYGVATPGSLTATTTTGDHPSIATSGLNSAKSVNRHWSLTNGSVVFDSAQVTLGFDAGDVDGGASTAAFEIARYAGGSWFPLAVEGRTATTTTATGVMAFGDFQIAEPFTGVTYTWDNGGGSSVWTTPANWSPDGVPGATDNAIINTGATVEISTARSVTSITVDHPSAVLRLAAGGTLSVGGNFVLTDGTLETQTSFPTISGSFSMSDGTVVFSGTGSQTIPANSYVDLTSNSTGARVLASAGTIGISGVFTPGSNAYTVAGSTVEYNGSGPQTIVAFNYHHLASSSTGARTLDPSDTIGVAGSFSPGSNSYTVAGSTVDFTGAGNQTIPSFSFHHLSNTGGGDRTLATTDTISIAGVFSTGAGSYTATGSIVEFNGSGSQTVPALAYHDLVSSGSGARVLASAGTIGVAGSFTPGGNSYSSAGSTVDFTSAGSQTIPALSYHNLSNSGNGDRILDASGTISVSGAFNAGSGITTSTGSTVEFNGAAPQSIPALTYHHLTSSNSGARTLASSGTIGVTGVFTPGSNGYTTTGSTVEFSGTGAQSIPAFAFASLTISGDRSGSTVTLDAGTISVAGSFVVTATNVDYSVAGNTLDFAGAGIQTIPAMSYGSVTNTGNGNRTLASSGTISIAGDLTAGSGTYTVTGSTINLNGSTPQTVSAFTYANLTVDNASGVTMTGASSVSGALTLTSGMVSLTADTLSIASSGSVSRTSGWVAGPLKKFIPTGATSRTFEVGDAAGYTPVLVAFGNVSVAGNLAVSTTNAEHPNVATSGISSALDANRYWTLAPNGITFTTYSATFTFVASDVDVGADATTFVVDQYDGGAWQLPTTGTVTSTSTQATAVTGFGGFVVGVAASSVSTSTAAGGAWNVGSTWVGGAVPGNNANVVIATTGGNTVTVTANPVNVRMLTINEDAVLEGAGATVLNLNLATGTNFINNGTINANGMAIRLAANSTWNGTGTYNLDAINLATRTLTFAFSSPETVSVSAAGNPFLNAGTLNAGSNSFVRFDGSAAQTLGVSALNFNGVIIDNTAGVTANANITGTKVSGDFSIASGTFDDGGFSVTLAFNKDFTVDSAGTYRKGGSGGLPTVSGAGSVSLDLNSTVEYYGTTQTVTQTTYGNLTILNAGTKTLEGDTTRIAGDFTITGATIDATTNLSTIELIGSGAQSIPAISYYRLLVTGTGPVNMAGPISLASDLEILTGIFDNNGNVVTLAAGRSVFLSNAAAYRAGGTTGLPSVSGGGSLSLWSLSTVEYYGAAQPVQATTYGHLSFLNAGTKTLNAGTTTIMGDMIITGATGDGATNATTVIYGGTNAQIVGAMAYHILEFTNAGLKSLSGSATTASTTTVNAGSAFRVTATGSLLLGGDLNNDGTFENQGTITVP